MSCGCETRTLNRKLVLESRDTLPDGAGGHEVEWVVEGALWAEVKARRGNEQRLAKRDRTTVYYDIYVRGAPIGAPSRPRPEQRFNENGRIFSILAVAEADPEGRYLRIWAEEGQRA